MIPTAYCFVYLPVFSPPISCAHYNRGDPPKSQHWSEKFLPRSPPTAPPLPGTLDKASKPLQSGFNLIPSLSCFLVFLSSLHTLICPPLWEHIPGLSFFHSVHLESPPMTLPTLCSPTFKAHLGWAPFVKPFWSSPQGFFLLQVPPNRDSSYIPLSLSPSTRQCPEDRNYNDSSTDSHLCNFLNSPMKKGQVSILERRRPGRCNNLAQSHTFRDGQNWHSHPGVRPHVLFCLRNRYTLQSFWPPYTHVCS